MLPNNTGEILLSLGYDTEDEVVVVNHQSEVLISWGNAPPISDQEIVDHGNDVTNNPEGKIFSQWLEENGGNPTKTKRRLARTLLQSDDPAIILLRAFLRAYAQRESLTRAQVLSALDAQIDSEAG